MIENSAIIGAVRRFWAWLSLAFATSVLYKLWRAVSKFVYKVFYDSGFRTAISGSYGMERAFEHSAIYKMLTAFNNFCASCAVRLKPLVDSSAIFALTKKTDLTLLGVYATAFFVAILPTKFILGLCVATVASFVMSVIVTGRARIKFQLMDLFVLLFAAIMIFSVFISYFPSSSAVMASTYLLFILFYFAARATINTGNRLRAVLTLVMISGGLVALYGIYQKMTGSFAVNEAWLDETVFTEATSRVYSTLENPNVLGEFMIYIVIISFAGLYFFKRLMNKLIAVFTLGASAYCMILTQSRGAWLGLLFGMALFLALYDKKLLWLAIPAIFVAPLVLPRSVIERFLSIGNMTDGSTSYRVNIWMASMKMVSVFWPIGIGMGTKTFIYIYGKYAFNAVNAPHTHNLFLQIIVDMGIWGLISFICLIAVYFKDIFSRVRRRDRVSAVLAAVAAGTAGFLVQGFTDNVWFNYRIVAFFWLMLAMAAGCQIETSEKESPDPASAESKSNDTKTTDFIPSPNK